MNNNKKINKTREETEQKINRSEKNPSYELEEDQ